MRVNSGTMTSKASEIAKQIKVTMRVTGVNRVKIRMFLFTVLVKIAKWICPAKVHLEINMQIDRIKEAEEKLDGTIRK